MGSPELPALYDQDFDKNLQMDSLLGSYHPCDELPADCGNGDEEVISFEKVMKWL